MNIDGVAIIAPMSATRPLTHIRAFVLVAALFAVTLAIMQPLAHAVMLRSVGPETTAGFWGSLCRPGTDGEVDDAGGATAKTHECCFGVAHSPVLLGPSVAALVLEHVASSDLIGSPSQRAIAGAIRDGPHQPRAPPSFD